MIKVEPDTLNGTWILESIGYINSSPAGGTADSVNRDATGIATFDLNGYMSIQICFQTRNEIHTNVLISNSAEDYKEANSYWAFWGKYSCSQDNMISVQIISSIFPNIVNHEVIRFATFEYGKLILQTAPTRMGNESIEVRACWVKP